jgi:cold shock CspA family protein
MLQGIEKPGMNDCFEHKEALETDGILHLLGGEEGCGRPGYR